MDPRLERLRETLVRRADVFEDPATYRAGVEDTIAAIDRLLVIERDDAGRGGYRARSASDLVVSA